MLASQKIAPPSNWQDFETLCMKLWGEIWDCSKTIKTNGSHGQKQYGVDIWGKKDGDILYSAIQCKVKKGDAKSRLTKKEIDVELRKVQCIKNQLKRFVFATTASKDVEIESYVRELDIKNTSQGGFEVLLYSWEDIVMLMHDYPNVYQWYMAISGFVTQKSLSITFVNGESKYIVNPQYTKRTTKYVLNTDMYYKAQNTGRNFIGCQYHHDRANRSWCRIPICVKNTGVSDIELEKVKIDCGEGNVVAVGNNIPMDFDGIIGSWGMVKPEVITCRDYKYGVLYQPVKRLIVSQDSRYFFFCFQPRLEVTDFDVSFEFFATQGFHGKFSLPIIVRPVFHEQIVFVKVNSLDEIREDEIEMTPYLE